MLGNRGATTKIAAALMEVCIGTASFPVRTTGQSIEGEISPAPNVAASAPDSCSDPLASFQIQKIAETTKFRTWLTESPERIALFERLRSLLAPPAEMEGQTSVREAQAQVILDAVTMIMSGADADGTTESDTCMALEIISKRINPQLAAELARQALECFGEGHPDLEWARQLRDAAVEGSVNVEPTQYKEDPEYSGPRLRISVGNGSSMRDMSIAIKGTLTPQPGQESGDVLPVWHQLIQSPQPLERNGANASHIPLDPVPNVLYNLDLNVRYAFKMPGDLRRPPVTQDAHFVIGLIDGVLHWFPIEPEISGSSDNKALLVAAVTESAWQSVNNQWQPLARAERKNRIAAAQLNGDPLANSIPPEIAFLAAEREGLPALIGRPLSEIPVQKVLHNKQSIALNDGAYRLMPGATIIFFTMPSCAWCKSYLPTLEKLRQLGISVIAVTPEWATTEDQKDSFDYSQVGFSVVQVRADALSAFPGLGPHEHAFPLSLIIDDGVVTDAFQSGCPLPSDFKLVPKTVTHIPLAER